MLALLSRVSIWIEDLCKYRFMNIGNMMYGVNVVNNVGSSHIISKLKTGQEMFENIQVHALHKCKLYTPTKVTQTKMILAWPDNS